MDADGRVSGAGKITYKPHRAAACSCGAPCRSGCRYACISASRRYCGKVCVVPGQRVPDRRKRTLPELPHQLTPPPHDEQLCPEGIETSRANSSEMTVQYKEVAWPMETSNAAEAQKSDFQRDPAQRHHHPGQLSGRAAKLGRRCRMNYDCILRPGGPAHHHGAAGPGQIPPQHPGGLRLAAGLRHGSEQEPVLYPEPGVTPMQSWPGC